MRTCNDLALHARCLCLTQGMRSGTAEKYYAGTGINDIPLKALGAYSNPFCLLRA